MLLQHDLQDQTGCIAGYEHSTFRESAHVAQVLQVDVQASTNASGCSSQWMIAQAHGGPLGVQSAH